MILLLPSTQISLAHVVDPVYDTVYNVVSRIFVRLYSKPWTSRLGSINPWQYLFFTVSTRHPDLSGGSLFHSKLNRLTCL